MPFDIPFSYIQGGYTYADHLNKIKTNRAFSSIKIFLRD